MTTAEKKEVRAELYKAYKAVISGKNYTISDGMTSGSYTRQDAEWIRSELDRLDAEIARDAGTGGRRIFYGVGRCRT